MRRNFDEDFECWVSTRRGAVFDLDLACPRREVPCWSFVINTLVENVVILSIKVDDDDDVLFAQKQILTQSGQRKYISREWK